MALQFCDSFDSYASTSDMTKRWPTNTASFSSSGGRFSGGAATSNFGNNIARSLPTSLVAGNTLACGFYYNPSTNGTPGSDTDILQFGTTGGGGSSVSLLEIGAGGTVRLRQLGSGSTNLITGTANVHDGQWHWIEFFVTLQTGATGSAQLWIDGVSQGSVSSTATVSSSSYLPVTSIRPNFPFSTATFLDDLIVWDYSGSFFNTSPLGPRRITCLKPAGDSTPLQFTPDTGTTHYTQVNGGYTNTHYVQDGSTGNADMYTYGSLAYSPSTVNAVVSYLYANNPGSGNPNIIPKLKTGSTTVSGTTFTLASGGVNTLYTQVWNQDATNTNWTSTTVNAMIAGLGD